MTDRIHLLRAILADPTDDLPRLALADWYSDHGEDDRAELVRVQVSLSKFPFPMGECECDTTSRCRTCRAVSRWESDNSVLLTRQARLLTHANRCKWFPEIAAGVVDPRRVDLIGSVTCGFIEQVRGSLADLRRCLLGLVGREPVMRVEVTDRETDNGTNHGEDGYGPPTREHWWYFTDDIDTGPGTSHWLPRDLLAHFLARHQEQYAPDNDEEGYIAYGSPDLARDALSDALLAEAREAAGITPLTVKDNP